MYSINMGIIFLPLLILYNVNVIISFGDPDGAIPADQVVELRKGGGGEVPS